ncbi:GDP-L-fucose synthetase [Rhodopseudomonas palustris]|uniref:GDP-L-fucose synthase family protein n=1 Tax=Rhodopseudomonas palustris TaxID=1076 RepID=UPI000D1B307C|nr:GDP-L-fucose synthase [Rhodopseudomonas palustris]AVT78136.1 GDP-L-fucose synthetase [Rhodopseudomonas palustris]
MQSTGHFDLRNKRVFVAGHRGMVGSAIVRRLKQESCEVLIVARDEVDLTRQAAVEAWMRANRPDAVFFAAGRVGGIHANNTYTAEFIAHNLQMTVNVIETAHATGVTKLLFPGSACMYPKFATQPMKEEFVLTGSLEPTNEPYAIAKIAGAKLCEAFRRQFGDDFIAITPPNLYGPGDNYSPEDGHVVAALLRRFHIAKTTNAPVVSVWGSGKPRREFLAVDDFADACVFAMKNCSGHGFLNVGTGKDTAIGDLARLIAEVVGYEGRIEFDASRPDGAPQRLLDASRFAALGWKAKTSLRDGLTATYADFLAGGGRNAPPSSEH